MIFFVLLCSELIFLFLLPCIVYHWCWWIKLIKNAKFGLFGITKCRLTSLWLCVAAPDNHQCRRLRFSVWCLTVLHKKFVDFDSGDWLFFCVFCILYFSLYFSVFSYYLDLLLCVFSNSASGCKYVIIKLNWVKLQQTQKFTADAEIRGFCESVIIV